MLYGEILREKGYSVKLKFWGVDAIPLNEGDAITLKNTLSNSFYNVFETLLRDGGSFNAYELEAFANIFDVDASEITEFLNNMMEMASRLMYKSNRTPEENVGLKMLHIDMERFRINMIKFIRDAMMEMAHDMSDEVILKYDSIFTIESLEYGGR